MTKSHSTRHYIKRIAVLENKVKQLQWKADYADRIMKSVDVLTVTEIAAEFNMSAVKLNRILESLGVQRKVNKKWILTAKYRKYGYTSYGTHAFKHNTDDADGSSSTAYWTELGRHFITMLLIDNGYIHYNTKEGEK